METARIIAQSCDLIDSAMRVVEVTLPDPPHFESAEQKKTWMEAGRSSVQGQLERAVAEPVSETVEGVHIVGVHTQVESFVACFYHWNVSRKSAKRLHV